MSGVDRRSSLPEPGARRVAVRVTADAARHVRRGSPWVYDGSVVSVGDGATGDLAVVFDERREFVGVGLYDPDSPIRVRVVHAGEQRLVDDGFWRDRLAVSLDRRAALAGDPGTDAYRLVHGENDGFGGLVVDRYADTLVAKVYTAAWLPNLRPVVDALEALVGFERIVLRAARDVRADLEAVGLGDGVVLVGRPIDGPVRFRERGLRMEADVVAGHKTGHFLDQRDNRALVRSMASGAEVLDVFSATGGFSLAAAAGGAASVHLVDVSGPAIGTARRNLELNRHLDAVRTCRVDATVGDAFEVLADLRRGGRRFDLVVVDPPSFASNARQVPAALRSYRRLTAAASALCRDGGTIVQASCSSRVDVEQLEAEMHAGASRAHRRLDVVRRTGHGVDHPVGFEHGAYLDAVFARVERA